MHGEKHRSERGGWLRAAVLGANDGIISTASLMLGVVASGAPRAQVLVAAIAGIVAGAMSMAAGEYVSVGSQRDSEEADIDKEKREHAASAVSELEELTTIYVARGLSPALARQVAEEMSRNDALSAHIRDELGLTETELARPLQAALVSAGSFGSLAFLPVLALLLVPPAWWSTSIVSTSLVSLALLGGLGGSLGGASPVRAALRVLLAGGAGMALAALIGRLLGVSGL